MSPLISVAVIGTGGGLGQPVLKALTDPTLFGSKSKSKFKYPIIAITTKDTPSDDQITYLQIALDEDHVSELAETFKHVDVVINLAGMRRGSGFLDPVKEAVILAHPKVYFTPIYGQPHGKGKLFPGFIDSLLQHGEEIRRSGVKTVNVWNGAFIDEFWITDFIDHMGANAKEGSVVVVDDLKDHILTYTYCTDVGKAIASLASLDPHQIPEDVYIEGGKTTLAAVVDKWEKSHNTQLKQIVISKDDALKQANEAWSHGEDPSKFFYYLSAIASLEPEVVNFAENDNELVNSGNKYWEWTQF